MDFSSQNITMLFIGGLPLLCTVLTQLIIEWRRRVHEKRQKYLELYYIPKRNAIIDYMSKLGAVAGRSYNNESAIYAYQAAFHHACLFVNPATKRLMEQINRQFEELCDKKTTADMLNVPEMEKLRTALNTEVFLDDDLHFPTHYPN